MGSAIHHMHRRKRIHQYHEPYPHPDRWKNTLDMVAFGVAFFSVAMTVPQVVSVWSGRDVSGVSPASWIAYSIASFVWVIYGAAHKEKAIMAVNALSMALDILVVAGVWAAVGHLVL